MPKYYYNHYFAQDSLSFGDVTLIQAGVLYFDAHEKIQPHKHGVLWEITAALDGKGSVVVNGKPETIVKGDIHLSCPCETHEIYPDEKEPLKYLFMAFGTKDDALSAELLKIQKSFKTRSRLIRNDSVVKQIELLIDELSEPLKQFHDVLCGSILKQIAVCIIRSYNENFVTPKKIDKKEEFCYRVMNYIDTHITEIRSLSVLSDVFNYNYSHISRLFKKTTGQMLSDYYQSKRLDLAKNMLEQGYSCSMVAEALNYSELYTFSKSFKARFKMSPMDYKKSIRLNG